MAFLDKFNSWYNQAVPDTAPGVSWMEPAEGARYRWKKKRGLHVFQLMMVLLILFLPLPGNHGQAPLPLPVRLILAGIFVGLFVLVWVFGDPRTRVILTKNRVVIGTGRIPVRYKLDSATVVRLTHESVGQALVFSREGREELRIFLEPGREAEILDFMVGAGLIEASNPSTN